MWREHFRHLAAYNAWANGRIYAAAAALSEEEYYAERGAFFHSMHGTLNHLLAIDLLWLGRIEPPNFPLTGYDMIIEKDFGSLRKRREDTDRRLHDLIDDLGDEKIGADFSWTTMEGKAKTAPLHKILTQVFNHQTHHRGQAHTLLSQAGHDPPPLDFFFVMFDPPQG
jgi:uncharacterized damage-inducible protein DinB